MASGPALQDQVDRQPADRPAVDGDGDPPVEQGEDGKDANAGQDALLSIFEEEVEDVSADHLLGEIASLSREIEERSV